MKFDTQTAAQYAAAKLDCLLERAKRDTAEAIEQSNIPQAVTYFAELRATVRDLSTRMAALSSHIDALSQELIPTIFQNQNVKTINVEGVGRVTVNDRWTGSLVDKQRGFEWLRQTGNEGLIIETVNAQTLGAFAKQEALEQRPLPSEIFKVTATPFVSITKA